ncbi:MAG: hypothetical protein JWO71_3960 [Candidatus Acidoferrum typicum]|nr:hypothetical protein [Candidatus Acidoferrum typicum]
MSTRVFLFTFESDFPKFEKQKRVQANGAKQKRVDLINPQAAAKIQPELMPGESVHWADTPNPKIIFHSDDWTAIPLTVMWTGFFVFWEAGALGYWGKESRHGAPDVFMALWGIPFLVVGNYMVWGRFFVDAWLKRRTFYAVTNRRVLVLQEGWKKKTSTTFLESIPTIEREGTETGTLWFGPKYPVIAGRGRKTRDLSRFSVGDVPVFADIENVESVYRLIMDIRTKAGKTSTQSILSYPSH